MDVRRELGSHENHQYNKYFRALENNLRFSKIFHLKVGFNGIYLMTSICNIPFYESRLNAVEGGILKSR